MKVSYTAVCVVLVVLLLSEAQLSVSVTCNFSQLSPCSNALVNNSPPSKLCCDKLREQRPCFCQYLRDPSLGQYVNSPNAKKVVSSCGVSIPNC
ncbi:PREDICTED: non-specific lipid-transfer protein 2-like [Nelumbo nucifera]|uniref:Non-specific lipid-transfer protein 2-like n=1 Tax=Nelumbo nucifera TaxID=4432 RepID=A0A1U8BPC8_NELNU|nr:PREDICTED: non-specific lipid-transfer protein 2-like [Nelumbo nucifera]